MKIKRLTILLLMLLSLLALTACGSKKYTVTFDSAGGSAVKSQSLTAGSLVKDPGAPENTGSYAFAGWYNGDKKWDFAADKISSSIKLTAKWTKLYTVHFDSNGGSPVAMISVEADKTAKAPASPYKEGYAFKGWYNGDKLWNFGIDKISENTTLTAKWNKLYTVTFSTGEGGSEVDPKYVENGLFITPPEAPTRGGYRFGGWYKGDIAWNFDSYMVTSDVSLSARWIKVHTVKYDSGEGADEILGESVDDGMKFTEPKAPAREGYVFKGWYKDLEPWDFNTVADRDITLTAKWAKLHTVTFDANGGSAVDARTAEDGLTVDEPATTRENHKFLGWFLNGEKWDFASPITGDITLTAEWKNMQTYEVKFDSRGGTEVLTQHIVHADPAIRPQPPELYGYYFIGWFYDDNIWDFNTPITSGITLYAVWEEIPRYSVQFDSNGGDYYDTIYVYKGEKIDTPPTPIREGFKFVGWYDHNGNLWDFNYGVSEDMMLTAVWEEYDDEDILEMPDHRFSYIIKFDTNGGNEIERQIHAARETLAENQKTLPIPEKAGYTFGGWYLNGVRFDENTPVTDDITLTAKWGYTVIFDTGDGETHVIADPGELLERPDDPTSDTMTFDGWYNGDQKWSFEEDVVTGHMTLTAKWK